MQLRDARLCLDCEEVHEAEHCPICASGTFAFINRWIPSPDRLSQPRPVELPVAETVETYRQLLDPAARPASPWRILKNGALGLAAFGVARWMWTQNRHDDPQALDEDTPASRTATRS